MHKKTKTKKPKRCRNDRYLFEMKGKLGLWPISPPWRAYMSRRRYEESLDIFLPELFVGIC
jgi:hypothetical protein